MACPCRALRAFTLTRPPFPRPALPTPSYRAYSTSPSDAPPERTPGRGRTKKPRSSARKPSSRPTSSPSTFENPRPIERRRHTTASTDPEPEEKNEKPAWAVQKEALKRKFPMGWAPPKKLSPDALSGLRALHAQFPETYTTPVLSKLFAVSPEAVRRILKSKWSPVTSEQEEERRRRWVKRGERVWERWAGMGVKVPGKWRPEGTSKWDGIVRGSKAEEDLEEERMEKKGAGRNVARRRVTGRIM